jgi:hypothetical protein
LRTIVTNDGASLSPLSRAAHLANDADANAATPPPSVDALAHGAAAVFDCASACEG